MPLIIFLEIAVLVITVLFGFVWLLQQPGFRDLFAQFQGQLQTDPQQILLLSEKIQPFLKQPGFIVAGFFVVSLFVPLIEELFKTLALWFFVKKNWSPTEGFVTGLLCGAAFAFAESLTSMAAIPVDAWLQTAFGRMGTGLLHIFTAGFSGWALTSTWQDGKYLRLGLVFLSNVFLHGIWNFFAILFGVGPFLQSFSLPTGNGLSAAAPWILVLIASLMFSGLITMNHKLQAESTPPDLPVNPPN
jgi:RsiW-degrading membrane proteinase PrsW (M82 family)